MAKVHHGDASQAARRLTQADAVRGSLWTLLASAVALPLSLAVTTVLARLLGADEFALFTLYAAIYLYAVPLFNAGFAESSMQAIAEAHATGRPKDVEDVVRRLSGYHLLVQGPLTVGLTVALLRSGPAPVMVAAGFAVAVATAVESSTVVLVATARNAMLARFALLMNVVSAIAVILTVVVTRSAPLTWAAQVSCLAIPPVLGFTCLSAEHRRAILRPLLPRKWPAGFLSYAGSALVGGYVSMLVFGRSELFVLSAFGQTEAVAAFALTIALAGKLTTLVDSLMAPIAPVAAGLIASAPELAPRALGRALRISTLLAGTTMALTVPGAAVLMPVLFGDEYAYARPAVVALGVVSCLLTAAGPLMAFAFATRSVRRVLGANVLCLSIDAALALILIGPIGLWGAVIASCTAQAVSAALLLLIVARRLELPVRQVALHARGLVVSAPALLLGSLAALMIDRPALAITTALTLGALALFLTLMWWPEARLWPEDVETVASGLPERLRGRFTTSTIALHLARGPS